MAVSAAVAMDRARLFGLSESDFQVVPNGIHTEKFAAVPDLVEKAGEQLVAGFLGRPAGDREAAIDAIVAIAAFAEHHRDRLVELDINPLSVLPKGRGAFAVDAMIRIAAD